MPEAIKVFLESKILYAPGKAANAGGVAVSALEMCQNSARSNWTTEEVNKMLEGIMYNILKNVRATAKEYGDEDNMVMGSNIAGFLKIASAMLAQGVV
jgi:glutamate dehydrogenase (NADP+)